MKTCPQCGQPMADEELFCASCGAKWEEPAPETVPMGGFCPNCGERLEENAVFCPNCGANLQTGEAPAEEAAAPVPSGNAPVKKTLSTRTIGMIAAGVAALVVIVLAVSLMGGMFSSPADKFISYQRELLVDQALKQVTDVAEQYNGYLGFSTDMTITANTSNQELRSVLRDSAVNLKVDLNKNTLLASGDLTIMGSPVLSGTVSYDKGVVGLYLPELDPIYYTADLGNLAVNAGADSEMAALLKNLEIPEISTGTLTKLGKCYIDVVLSAVNKDNVTLTEDKKFRLEQLHKNLEGQTYIFEPTAEDVEAMLLKLADTIEKDKDLRGFVTSFLGNNAALLRSMDLDVESELDEALLDAAEYLRDNAAYMGRSVERSGFRWILGISGKEVCLQRWEFDGGSGVIAYEATEGRSAFYVSSYGSINALMEMDYTKKDSGYSGSVTVSDGYSEQFRMNFKNVDKGAKSALGCYYGDYTLTVGGTELNMEVSKAAGGGSDHTLSVYNAGYVAGTYLDDFEVIIHTSDKKSTVSKPKATVEDISDYDYQDYNDLFGDLEDSLEQVMNDMAMEFYRSSGSW